MRFLLRVLVTAAALAVAAWLIDGIRFDGPTSGWDEIQEKVVPLLLVALILSLINSFVRPILAFLSIPFIIVTLGLFLLVINAGMLMFTSWLSLELGLGFHVDGFWTAVGGAIIVTLSTWLLEAVLHD
jgi:putative membrane protein